MTKTVTRRISIILDDKITKLSKELDISKILSGNLIASEPKFKIIRLPNSQKLELIQIKKIKWRNKRK